MILLDTGAEDKGFFLFFLSIAAFCVAIINLIVAWFVYLADLNSKNEDKKRYKRPLKIGLIALLVCGASLLLTSVLCSWWN